MDGLLFFLGPLDGLLFFLGPLVGLLFFLGLSDGLFFLGPLDGLLFCLGPLDGLQTKITFAKSGGGLLFKKNAANIEIDDYKTRAKLLYTFFNHETCLNVK